MDTVIYTVVKNPDLEYVRNLKKKIKANNGFCPCQMEKSEDTKCPCKVFRETQDCMCGLYIRIPELRD